MWLNISICWKITKIPHYPRFSLIPNTDIAFPKTFFFLFFFLLNPPPLEPVTRKAIKGLLKTRLIFTVNLKGWIFLCSTYRYAERNGEQAVKASLPSPRVSQQRSPRLTPLHPRRRIVHAMPMRNRPTRHQGWQQPAGVVAKGFVRHSWQKWQRRKPQHNLPTRSVYNCFMSSRP